VPERVVAIAQQISTVARDRVRQIQTVTQHARLLAINALIEAAHAGDQGKGFAVVAQEVGQVSDEIKDLSDSLTRELAPRVAHLTDLGRHLVTQVRGERLADLALNMIDIIDRNLYERSCDVRWWATDSAVVDCCAEPSDSLRAHASKRLGIILSSYTVYLDLWVADVDGRVIANGRPDRYPDVVGRNVASESWFTEALKTKDGTEFAVVDVLACSALRDALVATYSTAVRAGGETGGASIGALGIFFDWKAQAQAVVDGVRLGDHERSRTRCMLLDSEFRVIAESSGSGVLTERYPLQIAQGEKGYYTDPAGKVVGYARTPGYETYAGLGWYGVIELMPAAADGEA
jgi:hypothetical protein